MFADYRTIHGERPVSYLLNSPPNETPSDMRARYDAYRQLIEAARGRMPVEAVEFALAEWHYDFTDHRCPHDAWVVSVNMVESASGGRQEVRTLELRVVLLGAYHDGHIHLTYPGVRRYSLGHPAVTAGHGDWLVDEVRPAGEPGAERGLVVHEIAFDGGGTWAIEAENVLYTWVGAEP